MALTDDDLARIDAIVRAAIRSLREEKWDEEKTNARESEARTGTVTGGTSRRLTRRQIEAMAKSEVDTLEQRRRRSITRK